MCARCPAGGLGVAGGAAAAASVARSGADAEGSRGRAAGRGGSQRRGHAAHRHERGCEEPAAGHRRRQAVRLPQVLLGDVRLERNQDQVKRAVLLCIAVVCGPHRAPAASQVRLMQHWGWVNCVQSSGQIYQPPISLFFTPQVEVSAGRQPAAQRVRRLSRRLRRGRRRLFGRSRRRLFRLYARRPAR